jgi:hypothetical protein
VGGGTSKKNHRFFSRERTLNKKWLEVDLKRRKTKAFTWQRGKNIVSKGVVIFILMAYLCGKDRRSISLARHSAVVGANGMRPAVGMISLGRRVSAAGRRAF